jgi:tetratricopeptide (TPR) repeat protein
VREQRKQKAAAEQLLPFMEQSDPLVAAGVQSALLLLCLDLGKLVRAQELVQSLAVLEPDGYRPHYFMGLILKKLERMDEARGLFLEAVKRDQGIADSWRELVQCCADTGDFERALGYLQQVSARVWPVGQRRSWIYKRGVLYQRMGNYSLALVSYTELALDCLTHGMPKFAGRKSALSQVPPSAPRAALSEAIDLLEQRGLKPFPTAGTLLGWWREGDFLSHDKDIDIMLPAGTDWQQVLAAVRDAPGFWLMPNEMGYSNFISLTHRASGLVVDVSQHEQAGEGQVKCVWRIPGMPDDACRQTRQVAYSLVPDRFLTDVYGDWRTPMVDFDTVISGHHLIGFPDSVRCFAYSRLGDALSQGHGKLALSYVAQILQKDPLDPLSNHTRNVLAQRRQEVHGHSSET